MNINPIVLKQTSILSAILGALLGVLTLIPFIRNFSFIVLMIAVAAIIIVYMKKNDLIGIIDVQEGAILGAIIGFVSFIAFSIVFIPLVMLVGAIFKNYYTFGIQYFFEASGFFVLLLLVIFMGILSALMNAFSGLAAAYIYEVLSGISKQSKADEENIDFEIKD